MLLFTKKLYADLIWSGRKTIEIRAGSRYRHIAEGRHLSINGHFKVRALKTHRFDTLDDLHLFVAKNFHAIGFECNETAIFALSQLYSASQAPFFAFEIESPNRNPPEEHQSSAISS